MTTLTGPANSSEEAVQPHVSKLHNAMQGQHHKGRGKLLQQIVGPNKATRLADERRTHSRDFRGVHDPGGEDRSCIKEIGGGGSQGPSISWQRMYASLAANQHTTQR